MTAQIAILTAIIYITCALTLTVTGVAVLFMGVRSRLPLPVLGLTAFSVFAAGFTAKAAETLIIIQDKHMSAAALTLQLPALILWAIGCALLSAWMFLVFIYNMRARRKG